MEQPYDPETFQYHETPLLSYLNLSPSELVPGRCGSETLEPSLEERLRVKEEDILPEVLWLERLHRIPHYKDFLSHDPRIIHTFVRIYAIINNIVRNWFNGQNHFQLIPPEERKNETRTRRRSRDNESQRGTTRSQGIKWTGSTRNGPTPRDDNWKNSKSERVSHREITDRNGTTSSKSHFPVMSTCNCVRPLRPTRDVDGWVLTPKCGVTTLLTTVRRESVETLYRTDFPRWTGFENGVKDRSQLTGCPCIFSNSGYKVTPCWDFSVESKSRGDLSRLPKNVDVTSGLTGRRVRLRKRRKVSTPRTPETD